MLTGRKLALTLAFAALLLLAFGAGCRGFFTNPVLQSIAINPTAPQVNVGQTQNLQVYGTYDDGSRSVVKNGVAWSTDDSTVATIDANGVLTGQGPGSTGISASAEALSATASATVILTGATLAVTPKSVTVAQSGTASPLTFTATSGTSVVDITTDNGGQLAIPAAATLLTCTPLSGTEVCSADATTPPGTYTLTMSYAGATNTVSATVVVTAD
jgi:hypothetical protein